MCLSAPKYIRKYYCILWLLSIQWPIPIVTSEQIAHLATNTLHTKQRGKDCHAKQTAATRINEGKQIQEKTNTAPPQTSLQFGTHLANNVILTTEGERALGAKMLDSSASHWPLQTPLPSERQNTGPRACGPAATAETPGHRVVSCHGTERHTLRQHSAIKANEKH